MRLIPEWRKCLRMFSVQAIGVAAIVQSVWITLPAEMHAALPDEWVQAITIALLVAGAIGRLVEQPKLKESEK